VKENQLRSRSLGKVTQRVENLEIMQRSYEGETLAWRLCSTEVATLIGLDGASSRDGGWSTHLVWG
jgi:hypothetical protein